MSRRSVDARGDKQVLSGGSGLSNLYNHSCTLCPLHDAAETVCVEGSGEPQYRCMVVGEAPGRNEDHMGIPFVGSAGRVLDRALREAFCTDNAREETFVTNAVKCRPERNETPSDSDIDVCVSAYLTREIEAVDPTTLLACGNVAAQALLGETGIARLRGTWHRLDAEQERLVYVTYHPAYVLYRGGIPSETWGIFLKDVIEFADKTIAKGDRFGVV